MNRLCSLIFWLGGPLAKVVLLGLGMVEFTLVNLTPFLSRCGMGQQR